MADINTATGESLSQGRSPRFSLWIAFLVFSTITLGSSVEIVSKESVEIHPLECPSVFDAYDTEVHRDSTP
jgi:hypothetical protein